jgi:hypothetical protein
MKENLQWIGTAACFLIVGFLLGFRFHHKLYKESWEEIGRREKAAQQEGPAHVDQPAKNPKDP